MSVHSSHRARFASRNRSWSRMAVRACQVSGSVWPMRRLLAHRDTRLLLLGQSLSLLGDRAMFLALGIWVKTLTGSNAAAGMVFFVYIAPALAAPLAGLLVDRVRRRRLMIVTDLSIGA